MLDVQTCIDLRFNFTNSQRLYYHANTCLFFIKYLLYCNNKYTFKFLHNLSAVRLFSIRRKILGWQENGHVYNLLVWSRECSSPEQNLSKCNPVFLWVIGPLQNFEKFCFIYCFVLFALLPSLLASSCHAKFCTQDKQIASSSGHYKWNTISCPNRGS